MVFRTHNCFMDIKSALLVRSPPSIAFWPAERARNGPLLGVTKPGLRCRPGMQELNEVLGTMFLRPAAEVGVVFYPAVSRGWFLWGSLGAMAAHRRASVRAAVLNSSAGFRCMARGLATLGEIPKVRNARHARVGKKKGDFPYRETW